MKLSSLTVLLPWLFAIMANGQSLDDKTLMNIAGNNVTAGEFTRMYRKSLEPGISGNVDEYLQLFINFKLKVADAVSEGIDTTRAFRNELNGYRSQLSQNYLTDPGVMEKLLGKMYQRYLTEVSAWHILISCPEGAKPADTLIAWQKAVDIRNRIIAGESFEHVAKGASDDPSVKSNGGNLGFFTVFQMITPFEDAAYSLKKGALSQPVRTPYGYHIIKVTDRRPSRGKVLAAHIMKVAPPGASDSDVKAAGEAIQDIYRQLQEGASFSEMAAKYSDHKESASRGGKLDWFGTGELIPEISEAAFAITDTGKYSKPVRTIYAWHIIKLLDRKAPGSFEETRSFLESKINRTYLNSLSRKSFTEKLKKEYNYRINPAIFSWFVENTDTLIIQGLARYDRSKLPAGNLYTFANQHLTSREFASYIERRGPMVVTDDPESFIKQSIDARISDQIIKYEDSVLEKKYPDFRHLMTEFHDGILLFEISGKRVWNRVQEDTTGLMTFYEEHKHEHMTRRSMDAKMYILRSPGSGKKLSSAYRKYSRKPDTDSLMLRKFNRNRDTLLVIRDERFEEGDARTIVGIKWNEGVHSVMSDNYPALVVVNRIYEPQPRPFAEVQGEMMTAYQDYLESEWIRQLKEKYSVKIDYSVFDEIKGKVKDE